MKWPERKLLISQLRKELRQMQAERMQMECSKTTEPRKHKRIERGV